jgi:multidrug resistance efflux pump
MKKTAAFVLAACVALAALPASAQTLPGNVAAQDVVLGLRGPANSDIRALLYTTKRAMVSSDVAARIVSLANLGTKFDKNDIIAKFDCTIPNAELRVANAKVASARKMIEIQTQLMHMGVGNEYDLAKAKSDLDISSAEVALNESKVSLCTIRAPFDGQVSDVKLHPNEFAQAASPVIEILPLAADQIIAMVPVEQRSSFREGQIVRFVPDTGIGDVEAKVIGIVAANDPVSHTFKIIAQPTKDTTVPSGTTGKLVH